MSRRWMRVVAAAVLAGSLIGAGCWWALLRSQPHQAGLLVAVAAAAGEPVVVVTPPRGPTIPSTSATTVQPASPVWDLCGIGRLPIPMPHSAAASAAELTELPAHLGSMAAARLAEQVLAELSQGTLRQRAAALILNADAERAPAAAAQVAQLALTSNDPVVLSWAWSRCHGNPACARPLARAWAQAEPDNAVPWLAWWNSDPAVATEARARIAVAKRFALNWGSLLQTTQPVLAASDAAPYLRMMLQTYVIGFDAALSWPSFVPLTTMCNPAPKPGSEAQAACSAVAELLVDRSDTLLAYIIGSRMAESAGWPPERLTRLRAERKRIDAVRGELPLDEKQPLSCESVALSDRYWSQIFDLGELGLYKRKAALQERR